MSGKLEQLKIISLSTISRQNAAKDLYKNEHPSNNIHFVACIHWFDMTLTCLICVSVCAIPCQSQEDLKENVQLL